jgi:hypothetical protein
MSSDRWYIYKDDEEIGPLTAKQVRQLLREGEFDPFDKVSRENGTVIRELIDVDEIFDTSISETEIVEPTPAPTARFNRSFSSLDSGSSQATALDNGKPFIPDRRNRLDRRKSDRKINFERRDVDRRESQRSGGTGLVLADPKIADSVQEQASVESNPILAVRAKNQFVDFQKRYFLDDLKGRIVGPLSSEEIQQLYLQGKVPASVWVKKIEGGAKVKILKFISTLDKKRPGFSHRGAQGATMAGPYHQRANRIADSVIEVSMNFMRFRMRPLNLMISLFFLFLILLGGMIVVSKQGGLSSLGSKGGTQVDRKLYSSVSQVKKLDGRAISLGPMSFSLKSLTQCQDICTLPMADGRGETILVRFQKQRFNRQLLQKNQMLYLTGQISNQGRLMMLHSVL